MPDAQGTDDGMAFTERMSYIEVGSFEKKEEVAPHLSRVRKLNGFSTCRNDPQGDGG